MTAVWMRSTQHAFENWVRDFFFSHWSVFDIYRKAVFTLGIYDLIQTIEGFHA